MNGYKSRAELKQDAKDMLSGRWKDAVLMNLIPSLIIFAIIFILVIAVFLFTDTGGYGAGSMNDDGGGGGGSGSVGGIFSTLITTGISFAFLDAYRNHNYTFRPLKDAFRVFSRRYFLPVFFIYFLSGIFAFLWGLLLVIPGIIKSMAYSQAFLIYKDHIDRPEPDHISALDCITESKLLMQGHKMRYFTLQLSYLGWILVGVLTLGIGFLWITPYMIATDTAFYNDLVNGPFVNDDSYWDQPAYQEDEPYSAEEPENEWDELDF